MPNPVRIGLVGIGGWAATYINVIDALEKQGMGSLEGVVIQKRGEFPDGERRMVERGVPIYATLDEMLERGRGKFDIVALPVGIPWHRDLMIQTVEAGCNVVLEKPPAATVQDFDAMEAALARSGKWCMVGFQNQFQPNVIALQRLLCEGRIGAVREVVVKGFWMRDNFYYSRNDWAGKLRRAGDYVLDGVINNPMAHYLFNAFYFASNEPGSAAMPATVRAELYHAHEIESEDTACVDVACRNGVRVLFYGTLAATVQTPVEIEITGASGRATWTTDHEVKFYSGDRQTGGMPATPEDSLAVFRNAVRYLRGEDKALLCPLAMTRPHVLVVNGAFLSSGAPRAIPRSAHQITTDAAAGLTTTIITGIEELIARSAAQRGLFSDAGCPWAVKTKAVSVENLKRFELPA